MLFLKNHHLPRMNNHYLQWFQHRHHTKSNKLKIVLPSTNTNKQTETEPISLELFNCAAANLNAKSEIQLKKYQKYLFNHE